MEQFLGIVVRLYLANGLVLDGRVGSIDQVTQLLTLQEVSTIINGIPQRFTTYPVPGQDIKDLEILADTNAPPEPQHRPPLHPPPHLTQPPHHQHYSQPRDTPPLHQHMRPPSGPRTPHDNAYSQQNYGQQHHPSDHTSVPQYRANDRSLYAEPASRSTQENGMHYALQAPPVRDPSPGLANKVKARQPASFVDPAILSMSRSESASPLHSHPVVSPGQGRSAPPLRKVPSGRKAKRDHGTSKVPRNPRIILQEPSSIVVTESEMDEETVDYSEISCLEAPYPPRSQGRNKAGRQQTSSPGPRNDSQSHVDGSRPSPRARRTDAFQGEVANLSDDFDFQASLTQFDKRRIFAEIRQADATAPETLLVNLNRLRSPLPHGMQKLGIRDMVLDNTSAGPSGDETGNDAEVESDLDSDGAYLQSGEQASGQYRQPPSRKVCRTLGGVTVPSVTPNEMLEIERIAETETGPSAEQMIENGGRGCAMMVLQALGGNRRIKPGNHNDGPLVVVLVGNNKIGAFGLCAARHLANHECNVIVAAVGSDVELVNSVAIQQKIYIPTGGKLSRGHMDLPHPSSQPVDIIVDALLGTHQTILDLSEHDKSLACDLMLWANESKANVVSLDMPSGVNGVTGIPMSPSHHITPKWTMALGVPKTGHLHASRHTLGELFLADLGIPRIVFQKANKSAYVSPFGDKFLVGLEVQAS
ncbi:enhancer of mRNA decapping [Thoreauomyces humboldtii]|nr:enhancer of mRNA decapping [Thoreauomyces humboldtii]